MLGSGVGWCLGAVDRGLPEPPDVIGRQVRVGAEQREILFQRLGNEQAVERVAMMEG